MGLADYTVIVLAAGLGKRLAPLTNLLPKPACPLLREPICLSMIRQVFAAGAKTIHINTSYLSANLHNELRSYLSKTEPEILPRLRFWHETRRLETGGAILRIWQELENQSVRGVFVISGDIVGQIPIQGLLSEYEGRCKNTLATMAVKELHEERNDVTWVNREKKLVVGFGKNHQKMHGDQVHEVLDAEGTLFSNYQIIAPEALQNIAITPASSIPLIYENILKNGKSISAHFMSEGLPWFNVGTPQEYSQCLVSLIKHDWRNLSRRQPVRGPADKSMPTKAESFSGTILCLVPDQRQDDQTLSVQIKQMNHLPVERLNVLPQFIAISESQLFEFEEALQKFLRVVDERLPLGVRRKTMDAQQKEQRGETEKLTLWMRIPEQLLQTFRLQLPQPILVGANHFLEIALSQRGSLEAVPDWVDLLLTD